MPGTGRRIALIGFVAAVMLLPVPLQSALAEPPKFQVDPTWPQTLPSNWIIGTIGGIFVDAQDHIWINQRPSSLDAREKRASTATNVICCVPAPPAIEFDQAGKVVQGWGGDGPGYKWGNDGHGIHVDHDNFVWVGDNVETGGHIFKFTRDGKFALVSIMEADGELVVLDAGTFEEIAALPMKHPVGKYNVFNKITYSSGTSH